MNRYIIFDMDGVVIDSEGWYLNLLRNFLSKDTFNKLGYKAKINTHTTSYIN